MMLSLQSPVDTFQDFLLTFNVIRGGTKCANSINSIEILLSEA